MHLLSVLLPFLVRQLRQAARVAQPLDAVVVNLLRALVLMLGAINGGPGLRDPGLCHPQIVPRLSQQLGQCACLRLLGRIRWIGT